LTPRLFIQHPNDFYHGNYKVFASNLDEEPSLKLSNELEKELLSYQMSADRKTISITEKASLYYQYQNGKLVRTKSGPQELYVDLMLFVHRYF